LTGPSSAYPTERTPALICFNRPNDGCAPAVDGLPAAGGVFSDGAATAFNSPARLPASVIAAALRKWRRLWLLLIIFGSVNCFIARLRGEPVGHLTASFCKPLLFLVPFRCRHRRQVTPSLKNNFSTRQASRRPALGAL
jgi:hypothetical protein